MTTVSNVINGTGQVPSMARVLVYRAMRNTGFAPKREPCHPASSRSNQIALIYSARQVPFIGEVLFSAFNATERVGAHLVLRASSRTTKGALKKLALGVARSGIKALVLAPPCAEVLAGCPELSEMRVATFATGGALPGMHTLRIDNVTATATLTEYLMRLGHRRIGFIAGPRRHGDSKARRAGYEQAMVQSDYLLQKELIAEGKYTFDSGRLAAQHLLDLADSPTALVASNDEMAAGALCMAQERGLQIPHDLSVVGFDDMPTAIQTRPSLTVIRQPIAAMVEKAVTLLMEDSRESNHSEPIDLVLNHALIERDSATWYKPPS